MAPGRALELPSLFGVEDEYVYNGGTPGVCELSKQLLRLEIGSLEDWEAAHHIPVNFVQRVLRRWVEKAREPYGKLRMFDVAVSLRNFVNGWEVPKDQDDVRRLYLILDSGADLNPYIVGKLYDALFRIHPRLPVTFYQRFGWSCRKWFRIYDYSDLEYEIQSLADNLDPDDEKSDQATLNAWKAQVPRYMKRNPLPDKEWDRIVAGLSSRSKIRKTLELTTELYTAAHSIKSAVINQDERDNLDNCGNACPVFSLHFFSMDALRGCLDEEANMIMQTEPLPHTIIPFDVADGESIVHAFNAMAVAVKVVALAAAITNTLPGSD
jgi:hypothetical protein